MTDVPLCWSSNGPSMRSDFVFVPEKSQLKSSSVSTDVHQRFGWRTSLLALLLVSINELLVVSIEHNGLKVKQSC